MTPSHAKEKTKLWGRVYDIRRATKVGWVVDRQWGGRQWQRTGFGGKIRGKCRFPGDLLVYASVLWWG